MTCRSLAGRGLATTLLTAIAIRVDITMADASSSGSLHAPLNFAHAAHAIPTTSGRITGPNALVIAVRVVVSHGVSRRPGARARATGDVSRRERSAHTEPA